MFLATIQLHGFEKANDQFDLAQQSLVSLVNLQKEHFMNKDSKRCCDTTTPESIHTKNESKRGIALAFIFGVN